MILVVTSIGCLVCILHMSDKCSQFVTERICEVLHSHAAFGRTKKYGTTCNVSVLSHNLLHKFILSDSRVNAVVNCFTQPGADFMSLTIYH